jgi:hypothetical protein
MKLKLRTEKTVKTVVERYEPWEGAPIELVKTVVNRGKPKWTLEGRGPLGSRPTLLKSDGRDSLTRTNPFVDYKKSPFSDESSDLEEISIDLDALKERVVWCYGGGHMIFNLDGTPIPFPHHFDYIGTIFHNGRLKLKKAIEHLRNHPWIINGKDLRIEEIPYYNRDEEHQFFFSPIILPDAKEYARLFEVAKERDPEFPSVRLKEMISSGIYSGQDPLGLWQFLTDEGRDCLKRHEESMKPKVKRAKNAK